MEQKTWNSKYFYGHPLSRESLECGRITYADLVAPFSIILANDLMQRTYDIGYWEIENGSEVSYYDDNGDEVELDSESYWAENSYEEQYNEYYQYYIIEPQFAEVLQEFTDETVWYNEELDLHVWGVQHWGTSWSYVYTGIKIEVNN
jgi:hypothetical protein